MDVHVIIHCTGVIYGVIHKYTFPEMYSHNKVVTQQNNINTKQVGVALSTYFILIGITLLHIKLYKLILP